MRPAAHLRGIDRFDSSVGAISGSNITMLAQASADVLIHLCGGNNRHIQAQIAEIVAAARDTELASTVSFDPAASADFIEKQAKFIRQYKIIHGDASLAEMTDYLEEHDSFSSRLARWIGLETELSVSDISLLKENIARRKAMCDLDSNDAVLVEAAHVETTAALSSTSPVASSSMVAVNRHMQTLESRALEFKLADYSSNPMYSKIKVATLTQDSLVAIWLDGDQLVGQVLESNGRKRGSAFVIINSAGPDLNLGLSISVAAYGSGFVVVWANSSSTSRPGIYGQFFDLNGARYGSEFQVTDEGYRLDKLELVILTYGDLVVIWSGFGISAKVFYFEQSFTGSSFRIGFTPRTGEVLQIADSNSYQPSAFALPIDRLLVARTYAPYTYERYSSRVVWEIFQIGERTTKSSLFSMSTPASSASLTTSSGGTVSMTWISHNPSAVYARTILSDGSAGDMFEVATGNSIPSTLALTHSDCVMIALYDPYAKETSGQIFHLNGTRKGPKWQFSSPFGVSLSPSSDGGFFVARPDRAAVSPNRYGVYIQRFNSDGLKVTLNGLLPSPSPTPTNTPTPTPSTSSPPDTKFKINTVNDTYFIQAFSLLALANSSFVTAWARAFGNGSCEIQARLYNLNEPANTHELSVVSGDYCNPSLSLVSQNGFAITSLNTLAYAGNEHEAFVFRQSYHFNGTARGQAFSMRVRTSRAYSIEKPEVSITSLLDDSFSVHWNVIPENVTGYQSVERLFNADGTRVLAARQSRYPVLLYPLGTVAQSHLLRVIGLPRNSSARDFLYSSAELIHTNGTVQSEISERIIETNARISPVVTYFPGGNFMMAASSALNETHQQLAGRIFNPARGRVGESIEITVASRTPLSINATVINHNVVLLWEHEQGISGQLFNFNGEAQAAQFHLAPAQLISVLSLNDGGFLVTTFNGTIMAQLFNPSATPRTNRFIISRAPISMASAISLSSGDLIFMWSSASALYGQRFTAVGTPIAMPRDVALPASHSLPLAIVVGATVGGFFSIIVLAGAILMYRRRLANHRRHLLSSQTPPNKVPRRPEEQTAPLEMERALPLVPVSAPVAAPNRTLNPPDFSAMPSSAQEIGAGTLEEGEQLAGGTNPTRPIIRRAIWNYRDAIAGRSWPVPAVMKIFAEGKEAAFAHEARSLVSLSHPNVVKLYGVCSAKRALVLEPLRSLYAILVDPPAELPWAPSLPWTIRYRIALDIMRALQHLHDKGFLHRDIKSANVLVTNRGQAKLCDFELVCPVDSPPIDSTAVEGTIQYIPPELFKSGLVSYSRKTDLYATGITLWELASRKPPYELDDDPGSVRFKVLAREHNGEQGPDPSTDTILPPPDAYARLYTRLWHFRAEERPTIEMAIGELAGMIRAV